MAGFSAAVDDITVLGDAFVCACADGYVRQTTYLAPALDKRIERSASEAFIDLTTSPTTWIVAANAPNFNYWHWVAQVLPGILHCRDFLRDQDKGDIGLLTPPLLPFQRESLTLLDLADLPRVEIPPTRTCACATAVYSELMSGNAAFAPTAQRRRLREALLHAAPSAGSGRKVYVSRSDSPRRKMRNEAELEVALSARGFTVLNSGNLSVADQIGAFAHADVIVAPHGAALVNNLFCHASAAVLELAIVSYPNAAGASMLTTAGSRAWVDFFPDDGLGQRTRGWESDVEVVLDTLSLMS